jgi:carboxypeptidase Q
MRHPLLLVLLCAGALVAQEAKPEARPARAEMGGQGTQLQGPAAKLMREVAEHQEAYRNLEEMCDDIGARLTGSEKLRKAQAWAMDKLKSYGAVNVHEEAYDFGRAWTRGRERARLLNANGQELHLSQMAWTPSTKGSLRGEVVLLEVKTLDDLKAALPGLAGKIVLQVGMPRPNEAQRKNMEAYYEELGKTLSTSGIQVLLRDAGKKNDLLNMTGSPSPRSAVTIPTAFIAAEHTNLLKRLIARGQKPMVEVELGGTFSAQPVKAYNVVAELTGSELPDEVVIVGGHQDSWDLGTGATDNGTGTVVALEVLRAVKAMGVQPKRTLRIVLFSGEEEGLLGSKAYVEAHAKELEKIVAVLVDDMGTGRIKGFPDMGQESVRAGLAAAMAPAQAVGATEVGAFTLAGATDHWPFHQKGIPAFAATQDALDYHTHTHHSQVDTLDHVVKDDLIQGAQVMAATAWELLNGPALPRHAASANAR